MLDPKAKKEVIGKGLPASPGAASGMIVFTADEAEEKAKSGANVILVRVETSPEDIHGMHAARSRPDMENGGGRAATHCSVLFALILPVGSQERP
mgnify:CR=1 FL=1